MESHYSLTRSSRSFEETVKAECEKKRSKENNNNPANHDDFHLEKYSTFVASNTCLNESTLTERDTAMRCTHHCFLNFSPKTFSNRKCCSTHLKCLEYSAASLPRKSEATLQRIICHHRFCARACTKLRTFSKYTVFRFLSLFDATNFVEKLIEPKNKPFLRRKAVKIKDKRLGNKPFLPITSFCALLLFLLLVLLQSPAIDASRHKRSRNLPYSAMGFFPLRNQSLLHPLLINKENKHRSKCKCKIS